MSKAKALSLFNLKLFLVLCSFSGLVWRRQKLINYFNVPFPMVTTCNYITFKKSIAILIAIAAIMLLYNKSPHN